MGNALGIAGGTASGQARLNVKSGSMTKRYQGGHAAMGGLLSALLAKEGFTGPSTVLEGADGAPGFVQARSCNNPYDLSIINDKLGGKWEMLDTAVKYNACCSYLAPVIDCCMEIVKKNDIKPKDIDEVTVKVCRQFLTALGMPKEVKYKPQTIVHAQFSIPYGVGVAVCRRRAFFTEFTMETIKDPQILEVASKVKMEMDPEAEKRFPTDYVAKVDMKTKDGKIHSATTYHAKGTVENPLSDEELMVKFRNLTEKTLSPEKAERVMEMVWKLDELKDVSQLIDYIHDR
jgi:2-methylcitrate dehydratase PrpD